MAEIVYSARKTGFDSNKVYRNPRYFSSPLASKNDTVTVEGDWPAVVAAYKAIGIEVSKASEPKEEKPSEAESREQQELIKELRARGINRDKRTSVEKLRELLEESDSEIREEISGELTTLGVEHNKNQSVAELRAALAQAKAEV